MRRGLGAAVGVLSLFVAPRAALADGQEYHEAVPVPYVPPNLTVPFEYGHAAAWVEDRTGPVYRMTLGVLPGYLFGRLSVHAALQLHYRNPDWDGGFGGRVTFLVAPLFGGLVPLRLLAETTYLPVGRGVFAAGGVAFGLGNLIGLSLLAGDDSDRRAKFVGVRLAFELSALGDPVGAITRFVPSQSAPRR